MSKYTYRVKKDGSCSVYIGLSFQANIRQGIEHAKRIFQD